MSGPARGMTERTNLVTTSTAQSPAPPSQAVKPSRTSTPAPRRSRATFRSRLRKDWQMLVLMIPGALCLLLFFYVPILGNVIAF